MGELAMRPVDHTPLLGDLQDAGDFFGCDGVNRPAAGRKINKRANSAAPSPPPVHTVIRDLPQAACPSVRKPGRHRDVNGFEDEFFHVGEDPRRNWSGQPQLAFPRTTASSIA